MHVRDFLGEFPRCAVLQKGNASIQFMPAVDVKIISPVAARSTSCPSAAGRPSVPGSKVRFSSLMNAFISNASTKPLLMPFGDFTLSLQPVIQFMTVLPAPCFEELVSTFADEVRNAFEKTATRVRVIVHSVQFQTFGNLSDYSHVQIASFVLINTDRCPRVINHASSEYFPPPRKAKLIITRT